MIIDAHNHPDWHDHDIHRFVDNMDTYGIEKCWLLTWECPRDEHDPAYNSRLGFGDDPNGPIPFSRVLEYKERYPDRFVMGYAPDPRRPDAVDRLRAAVSIYGVRTCGEIKLRMMYDNPDALRLFRACGDMSLPVTVHIDYEFDTGVTYPRPSYWYGGGIEAFERAVAACPDTVFIGHAPGFWAHISGDYSPTGKMYPDGKIAPEGKTIEMFRRYDNLYCDLSAGSGFGALNRDHDFAVRFIEEFQNRILFGRDYFDDRLRLLLQSFGLSTGLLNKVFAENALRLERKAEETAAAQAKAY